MESDGFLTNMIQTWCNWNVNNATIIVAHASLPEQEKSKTRPWGNSEPEMRCQGGAISMKINVRVKECKISMKITDNSSNLVMEMDCWRSTTYFWFDQRATSGSQINISQPRSLLLFHYSPSSKHDGWWVESCVIEYGIRSCTEKSLICAVKGESRAGNPALRRPWWAGAKLKLMKIWWMVGQSTKRLVCPHMLQFSTLGHMPSRIFKKFPLEPYSMMYPSEITLTWTFQIHHNILIINLWIGFWEGSLDTYRFKLPKKVLLKTLSESQNICCKVLCTTCK